MSRNLLMVLAVALAVACTARPTAPSANLSGEAPPAESAAAEPWRARVPKPGRPSQISQPVPEQRQLDNGLEVLSIEREQLPLVYLRLIVRSGSSSDPL